MNPFSKFAKRSQIPIPGSPPREIVRGILERTEFVAVFRDAPAEAGGWGATIVDLK